MLGLYDYILVGILIINMKTEQISFEFLLSWWLLVYEKQFFLHNINIEILCFFFSSNSAFLLNTVELNSQTCFFNIWCQELEKINWSLSVFRKSKHNYQAKCSQSLAGWHGSLCLKHPTNVQKGSSLEAMLSGHADDLLYIHDEVGDDSGYVRLSLFHAARWSLDHRPEVLPTSNRIVV